MKRTLQLNPDNRPATWVQIRDWRETHKRAPVTTSMGVFDADEIADLNFQGMIEQFDHLPTLDEQNRLTWKRADNSYYPLTKTELQQVYNEVKTNRAIRGALIHVQAEVFNTMDPKPTVKQLSDMGFWLG